eukprot:evm.model.NODE_25306_length_10663_cov_36.015755.2
MELAIGQQPSNSLAYTNRVYVSLADWDALQARVTNPDASKTGEDALLVSVNGLVFTASYNKGIDTGSLGLNSLQRRFGLFTLTQRVKVDIFESNAGLALTSVVVRVDLLAKGKVKAPVQLATEEMAGVLKAAYLSQVLQMNQSLAWDFKGTKLELTVESFQKLVPGGDSPTAGMTNRKDMIDEAIIRPGRLEVHVEIGLPDEAGRLQIISIHTKSMRDHKRIAPEALDKLAELARATKNFSGAEIEGLVKSAASFAFQRNVNVKDLSKLNEADLVVQWSDFQLAQQEVQPRLGANSEELEVLFRNGIVPYGPAFESIMMTLRRFVQQLTGAEEIKAVLREVVAGLSQKEMDDIASAISKPIGIKQLLMVTEMARQEEETVSTDRFLECLHICGF